MGVEGERKWRGSGRGEEERQLYLTTPPHPHPNPFWCALQVPRLAGPDGAAPDPAAFGQRLQPVHPGGESRRHQLPAPARLARLLLRPAVPPPRLPHLHRLPGLPNRLPAGRLLGHPPHGAPDLPLPPSVRCGGCSLRHRRPFPAAVSDVPLFRRGQDVRDAEVSERVGVGGCGARRSPDSAAGSAVVVADVGSPSPCSSSSSSSSSAAGADDGSLVSPTRGAPRAHLGGVGAASVCGGGRGPPPGAARPGQAGQGARAGERRRGKAARQRRGGEAARQRRLGEAAAT